MPIKMRGKMTGLTVNSITVVTETTFRVAERKEARQPAAAESQTVSCLLSNQ